MRRLTAREITIVALGAGLAIVLILGLGVFRPAVARLQTAQRELAASSQELAQDNLVRARLPGAQRDNDAANAALKQAENQIPNVVGLPQVVSLLVNAIDGTGGELVGLEFPGGGNQTSPMSGNPLVQELTFKMTVRGTWAQIVSFLHRTETLPRLIAVANVSVTKDNATAVIPGGLAPTVGAGAPGPTLRADLTLRAFSLH